MQRAHVSLCCAQLPCALVHHPDTHPSRHPDTGRPLVPARRLKCCAFGDGTKAMSTKAHTVRLLGTPDASLHYT